MKTCINISFPSKVRFRKKVHSQASDHVWFFLNLFSKRPREKKEKKKKEKKKKKKEKKGRRKKKGGENTVYLLFPYVLLTFYFIYF